MSVRFRLPRKVSIKALCLAWDFARLGDEIKLRAITNTLTSVQSTHLPPFVLRALTSSVWLQISV